MKVIDVGDKVIIIGCSQKSKKWTKCLGFDLVGQKGEVIEILNLRGVTQGIIVKFPFVYMNNGDGKRKVSDFEWSFYNDEVQKIEGGIK